MSTYSKKEQEFMLGLAKNAILSGIDQTPTLIPPIPLKLRGVRACFVTLTIKGQLRGCIGHIMPMQELCKDIIENAKSAAFEDPRFPPVRRGEFPQLEIELSILSLPKSYTFETTEQLLQYLGKVKPGVILSKGSSHATFLPQVWDDLPDPPEFLTHLCAKAGLPSDAWKHEVDIQCYFVTKIPK